MLQNCLIDAGSQIERLVAQNVKGSSEPAVKHMNSGELSGRCVFFRKEFALRCPEGYTFLHALGIGLNLGRKPTWKSTTRPMKFLTFQGGCWQIV